MRIALISAAIHSASGGTNVALMPLAGRSLAHRQVDLALALGCERIACLADGPSGEILRLQHAAERAGAKFHAITSARPLCGLAGAADEIVVMAPGVLTDARLLRDALGGRHGILTLPAERAVPAGFERIDGETAWGGFLIVPGSAAERLSDLPRDGDPVSGLLRIALQLGVRRVVLAPASLDAGDLLMVTDAETLSRAERRWLRLASGRGSWRTPAVAFSSGLARFFAARVLTRRRGALSADVGGVVLAAGAAALAWLEKPAAGLALLALCAAVFVAAQTWRAIERGAPAAPSRRSWAYGNLLVDGVLFASVIVASPRVPGFAAFAAASLVLSVRMAAAAGSKSQAAPAGDRIAILSILAVAAAFGQLLPAIQALVLAGLALNLFAQSRTAANAGLTTPR